MAKLLAAVSRALWLIVALAVIVRLSQAGLSSLYSTKDKKPEERTNEDWRKPANKCAGDAYFKGLKSYTAFINNLKIPAKETDCTEKTRNTIVDLLGESKSKSEKCFKLMREYLPLYLKTCDYEELFVKATSSIKGEWREQFRFADYQTLASYVEVEFLQEWISGGSIDSGKLRTILSDIEKIAILEGISKDTDCTDELQTDLVKSFVRDSMWDRAGPLEFRKINFALYLDKCGYERLFNELVEHKKQRSHEHWDPDTIPTLYSYAAKHRHEKTLFWILSIIKELSTLDSISGRAQCTAELEGKLLKGLGFSQSKHPLMCGLAEDYFGVYLDKCGLEAQFEKTIGLVKQTSAEPWDLVRHPNLYSYLMKTTSKKEELAWILAAIRQLSAMENMSQETDCTAELLDSLVDWLDKSFKRYRELHVLIGDYIGIYLSKCGYDGMFDSRVEHIKQGSHEHWDSDKFPNLYSLLIFSNPFMLKENYRSMLTTIKEFSALDSMSQQTHCTSQLQTSLLESVFADRHQPYFVILIRDFFSLYLEKCGFEESFKKRIADIKRKPHERWDSETHSTLYLLIRGKLWSKDVLNRVMPVMKKLSEFDDTSKEPDCSQDLKWDFIEWLVTSRRQYRDLHLLLKSYIPPYKNRCGVDELLE